MNFIAANPALCALLLMIVSALVTVIFDIRKNGATLRHLWAVLVRDKLSTAIMFLMVYAVCFLCVHGVIAGLRLFDYIRAHA